MLGSERGKSMKHIAHFQRAEKRDRRLCVAAAELSNRWLTTITRRAVITCFNAGAPNGLDDAISHNTMVKLGQAAAASANVAVRSGRLRSVEMRITHTSVV